VTRQLLSQRKTLCWLLFVGPPGQTLLFAFQFSTRGGGLPVPGHWPACLQADELDFFQVRCFEAHRRSRRIRDVFIAFWRACDLVPILDRRVSTGLLR